MPLKDPKVQAFLEKTLGKPVPGQEGKWELQAGLGMLPTPGILEGDAAAMAGNFWKKGMDLFQNGDAMKVVNQGGQWVPVEEEQAIKHLWDSGAAGWLTKDGEVITAKGPQSFASGAAEKAAPQAAVNPPAMGPSQGGMGLGQMGGTVAKAGKKAPKLLEGKQKLLDIPTEVPHSPPGNYPAQPPTNASDLISKLSEMVKSGQATPSKIDTLIQDLANLSSKHNLAQGVAPNMVQNNRAGYVKMFQDFVKSLQKK